MSRLAMFCAGMFLACSLSGCCLMHGCGYPGGSYYGSGGGCAPCNNGCGAYAAPGYPSAGLYGAGAPAAAYIAPPTTAGYAPYYPQAAMVPMDTLPTH